jgi:hypothetical protein
VRWPVLSPPAAAAARGAPLTRPHCPSPSRNPPLTTPPRSHNNPPPRRHPAPQPGRQGADQPAEGDGVLPLPQHGGGGLPNGVCEGRAVLGQPGGGGKPAQGAAGQGSRAGGAGWGARCLRARPRPRRRRSPWPCRPRRVQARRRAPARAPQDVKADLKRAKGRPSPFRREYVLPDGVHNLRGYVKPTPEEGAAAGAGGGAQQQQQQQHQQQHQQQQQQQQQGGGGGGGAEQGQQEQEAQGQGQQQQPAPRPRAAASDQVLVLNNELFMVPEVLFRCAAGQGCGAGAGQCSGEVRAWGWPEEHAWLAMRPAPRAPTPTLIPPPSLRPNDIGLQQAGLPEAVAQAISACHTALAPLLWSNVILTGGCCRLPGLAGRFAAELRSLAPDDFEVGVVNPQVALVAGGRTCFGVASCEIGPARPTAAPPPHRTLAAPHGRSILRPRPRRTPTCSRGRAPRASRRRRSTGPPRRRARSTRRTAPATRGGGSAARACGPRAPRAHLRAQRLWLLLPLGRRPCQRPACAALLARPATRGPVNAGVSGLPSAAIPASAAASQPRECWLG